MEKKTKILIAMGIVLLVGISSSLLFISENKSELKVCDSYTFNSKYADYPPVCYDAEEFWETKELKKLEVKK
jgi:hypothetical protein